MDKINISALGPDEKCFAEIQKRTLKLPNKVLFTPHIQQFIFDILNLFDFKDGTYIRNDHKSMETACRIILITLGIQNTGNPTDQFISQVLGFKCIPFEIFYPIHEEVIRDLSAMLKLIYEYEQDSYIIEFLKGNDRPEYESRIRIDFYKRCLHWIFRAT
jgi:hypothetical protein